MVKPRVTKALNPHRRKLSIAQIRAGFGGKRRRASLKASKRHAHRRPKAHASNPKKTKRRAAKARPRVVYRTRTKVKYRTRTKNVYIQKPRRKASTKAKARSTKRRRSSNPGQYLLTMAPVGSNPYKKRRKTYMAKQRRKVSARGRSGKRRNPTRRSHRAKVRRMHRPRSRNPFGEGSTSLLKKGAGVFVGFSAAKKLPPMLGAQMNSSPGMTLLSTAITAGVVAWIARRFMPGVFAEGVLWGGVAGVINVAWNAWAPSSIVGYAGVGDFAPGGFPLPQGPVRYITSAAPDQTPTGSQVNVGAFGRAW